MLDYSKTTGHLLYAFQNSTKKEFIIFLSPHPPFLWTSIITLIIKQLLPYGPEITTETL